jgi:predicted acyltransferase
MSAPSPALLTTPLPSHDRLTSLDQFRGYTVAGMLLVNFLGSFVVCPKILRHSHDYLSYADTIMPQFLFAVGFALRMTFGRRVQTHGLARAHARIVRRLLGLMLISVVIYQVAPRATSWNGLVEMSFWGAIAEPLKRSWFQTLMHIAVTSLWLLPVLRAGAAVRVLWMLLSAAAHVVLSHWFNFEWVNSPPNGIDGGPLGFLTWTIPALVGTLACDAVFSARGRPFAGRLFAWSCLLMVLGYVQSCGTRLYDVPPSQVDFVRHQKLADDPVIPSRERVEVWLSHGDWRQFFAEPPFVPPPDSDHRKWNYWMMSQRAGTLSYLTFSAGFSLAVFVLFHLVCDHGGFQVGLFRTFGTNALAAYVLHGLVSDAVKPFVPRDAPAWYVAASLVLFFLVTWVFVRHLEKRGIFLRV